MRLGQTKLGTAVALAGLVWFAGSVDSALGQSQGFGYTADPLHVPVATVSSAYSRSGVTDLELADFDGDGRLDIAALWFANHALDPAQNLRRLTILTTAGPAAFTTYAELDLYEYNASNPGQSIFELGTGELAVGDFDGDGDTDLAALVFFGDELWFVENQGGGNFAQFAKFPFFVNSSGNFQTPPKAIAADFNGDGRDELVYVSDPASHIQGYFLHFWSTFGSIAGMYRTDWESIDFTLPVSDLRSLTTGDFDGDGTTDVCFIAREQDFDQFPPKLIFWHDAIPGWGWFFSTVKSAGFVCSDIVTIPGGASDGVVMSDQRGTMIERWLPTGSSLLTSHVAERQTGFSNLSLGAGMSLVAADLNDDGRLDYVVRQNGGEVGDVDMVELATTRGDGSLRKVKPNPFNTFSVANVKIGPGIRPRLLAAGELINNLRLEVVSSFLPTPIPGGQELSIAIWTNRCVGDVDNDCIVDAEDVDRVFAAWQAALDGAAYDPAFDLNRDGEITADDVSIVVNDFDCVCNDPVE